ncbi:MAG: o-succinylbenzoate synthase [Phycisphaerales bacterium]|jgi:O-succinylbenzoate synthase|nr:o-succinylbenzoate synthase [Phycisphaerales bacterium]
MKIDRIELYRVGMPLVYPFRTAFGNDAVIESVLVKLCGPDGFGWGEAAPWRDPAYSAEWAQGLFLLIAQRLGPMVVGRNFDHAKDIQLAMSPVKDNRFAKAAIDLAWWDLFSRSQNQPLWKTIGGGPVAKVGADFGVMENIDALLSEIDKAQSAGFERIKLKYRPGWELEMISAVRRAFPKMVFHVDCNSAYTLADLPMLRKLDEFDLAMIEQPLSHDDLIDHAKLAREMSTPICLDESITTPDKARKAIEIGACRWINIKHGRVGGLTNALEIHNIARDAGIGCWVGSMCESAVGHSFGLALASLPNMRYPADIFPTDRFYRRDLADKKLHLSAPSQIRSFDGSGIGVIPDEHMLKQCTLEMAVISG